jgi:hypothetical protein
MPRQADILRICVPQALLGTSLRGESRQHPWRIQVTSSTQLTIEIEGSADEGEVSEGLRKVAQRLA